VSSEPVRSPREEAERLVAAALGAASAAIQGLEARRQLRDIADRLLGGDSPWTAAGAASGTTASGAAGTGAPPPQAGTASGAAGTGAASGTTEAGAPPPEAGTAATGGARFATGSAECCICPLCRLIAALRDPNPDFAERVAAGAGDLANGVASALRAFAGAAATIRPESGRDDPWRAATTGTVPPQRPASDPAQPPASEPAAPPKPMAKKAVKKTATKPAQPPPADTGEPADGA